MNTSATYCMPVLFDHKVVFIFLVIFSDNNFNILMMTFLTTYVISDISPIPGARPQVDSIVAVFHLPPSLNARLLLILFMYLMIQ